MKKHKSEGGGSEELLYFAVGVRNATVNQATLRMFAVGPLGQSTPTTLTLRVYRLVEEGPARRVLLDTASHVLQGASRWFELDVAAAVDAWLSGSAR